MALIPQAFLDAVVALEQDDDKADEFQAVASGVLVGFATGTKDEKGDAYYRIFLVTNRHIVEGAGSGTLYARFNNGETSDRYVLELESDGQPTWLTCDGYDVAAIRINVGMLKDAGAEFFFIPDEHWATVAEMKELGVAAGDDVFVLGFPMGIAGIQKKYALVRGGVIARFDEDIINEENAYLIDCSVFPGNSGGPVVLRPQVVSVTGTESINRAVVVGIVSSSLQYSERAISAQSGRTLVTFEDNSGLTTVVPIDAVRDAVAPAMKAQPAEPPQEADDEPPVTTAETGQADELE